VIVPSAASMKKEGVFLEPIFATVSARYPAGTLRFLSAFGIGGREMRNHARLDAIEWSSVTLGKVNWDGALISSGYCAWVLNFFPANNRIYAERCFDDIRDRPNLMSFNRIANIETLLGEDSPLKPQVISKG
jgi:hypothetical protein